jgi:hypothetical protein
MGSRATLTGIYNARIEVDRRGYLGHQNIDITTNM